MSKQWQKEYIEKLTIDVFGFSRGAACARYAIHMILEGRLIRVDDESGDVGYSTDNFASELERFTYTIRQEAVEVGFAGLYDTVLSYIGSQWLPWAANTLKQKAVAHAKKVLHLAAADEHRFDFPLHKITSAINKKVGEEYYLPGVHSDIGGSYNLANNLLLDDDAIDNDDEDKIYMRTSNEGISIEKSFLFGIKSAEPMMINRADPERIAKDRQDLIDQGWYTESEIHSEVVKCDDTGEPTRSILTVERNDIHSSYCNIPLKIMARYARDKGAELKIVDKLERRANRILRDEKDLQDLEITIDNYINSHKGNSLPEDWKPEDWDRKDYKGKKPDIDKKILNDIRHKHFHFSASKMSVGYKPNFEWDWSAWKFRRKRYYYNA